MKKIRLFIVRGFRRIIRLLHTLCIDFFHLLRFIYSPIAIVIAFGKNLVTSVYRYAKNQTTKYIKFIKDFFTQKIQHVFPGYNRRKFERFKRRLFSSKNDTFLNSNFYAIVMLSTAGLQCISFFTTFRGALSFFEGVHWIAPLLFTGVLQVLFWCLANTAFSKRRRAVGRVVMLIFIACVSATLSYIGIANSSMPPTETYREEYEKFSEAYEPLYDEIKAYAQGRDFKRQINETFDSIANSYNFAEQEINALNTQIKQIGTPRTSYQHSSYNPATQTIETNQTPNPYFSEQAVTLNTWTTERNALVSAMNGYTKSQVDDFRQTVLDLVPSNWSLSTTDYSTEIENLRKNESVKFDKYAKIVAANNNLVALLQSNYQYQGSPITETDLGSLLLTTAITMNVENLKLSDYSSLEGSIENDVTNEINKLKKKRPKTANTIYNFLLQGTEDPQYTEGVYQKITNEMNTKYTAITSAYSRISDSTQSTNNLENLKKLWSPNGSESSENSESGIHLQDPYTFAFSHIAHMAKENVGKIALMLFFAAFVDGMTVLIPLFVEKRRYSALFTKSSQDVFDDQEDVLENLLLSFVYPNKPSQELDYHSEEEIYHKMLGVLSEYVKLFEPSPFTKELGYPKRLKAKSPTSLPSLSSANINDLTAFLLDMGYIKFVSRREYYLLQCDYYGIQPYEDKTKPLDEYRQTLYEDGYYLMKSNFILWLNDNHLSWMGYQLATESKNDNESNASKKQKSRTAGKSKSKQKKATS